MLHLSDFNTFLFAISPTCRGLFASGMQEALSSRVYLEDADPKIFSVVLNIINGQEPYIGKISCVYVPLFEFTDKKMITEIKGCIT